MPRSNLCPLLLASVPASASLDRARCRLNDCAWFLRAEGKAERVGSCAVKKIASNLHMINSQRRQ